MHNVANAIIVLWGWRRVAVAIAAGACSALALPPWSAFPVLWLSLPVLIWLIDGAVLSDGAGFLRRLSPGAIVGWSFGFGYFLAGLWWLGISFPIDTGSFAWAMPLAVVVLSAGLALFWALGAVLARLFWPDGWPRILVFAAAFSGAEWLRGHVLTGFPWNAFGYTLTPAPIMMQSAAIIGLWGLTLAAFIVFSAPALLVAPERDKRGSAQLFVAFAATLFLAHVAFGLFRLSQAPDSTMAEIHLRIVQPTIEQGKDSQQEDPERSFRRYLQLSDGAKSPGENGIGGITLLVWPELAVPFFLTDRPEALAALAALLPDGTTLLTGAARLERAGSGEPAQAYNSIYAIGDDGEILAAYDKVRLVPFSEFQPFHSVLAAIGLNRSSDPDRGFAAGARRQTLTLADMPPFAPLIGYEVIFPGAAADPDSRPGWLLNVTDDAWIGNELGSHQHFLQARVRAVEEGLPLVRAAKSGISAIIDANGRVVASLNFGRAGVVDGDLPVSLSPTPYSLYGGWIFLKLLVASLGTATIGRMIADRSHN